MQPSAKTLTNMGSNIGRINKTMNQINKAGKKLPGVIPWADRTESFKRNYLEILFVGGIVLCFIYFFWFMYNVIKVPDIDLWIRKSSWLQRKRAWFSKRKKHTVRVVAKKKEKKSAQRCKKALKCN